MSGDRHGSASGDLVYMVTGVDENGDTHIFVTSDLQRAEARHSKVKAKLTDVKANWLDKRLAGKARSDAFPTGR